MLDRSFIEKIESLVEDGIIQEVDGVKYSSKILHKVYDDPRPAAVQLYSLSGLLDYIRNEIDIDVEIIKNIPHFIHIMDYNKIELVSALYGERVMRDTIVEIFCKDIEKFRFNEFMPVESFLIKCRSLFVETDDLKEIIAQASKIDSSETLTLEDDGITQKGTLRKGASGAVKENTILKCIVKLKPFRTFLEIDQPESEFLFRIKAHKETGISCALFEADGGKWKITAKENIKEYLRSNALNLPVIG